jgi:hypothetical protein
MRHNARRLINRNEVGVFVDNRKFHAHTVARTAIFRAGAGVLNIL